MKKSKVNDPFELLKTNKLERIVNGCLRQTIRAHGPITNQFISSASKRLATQVRGYLRQFASQSLLESVSQDLIDRREQAYQDLQEQNSKLKRRVAVLGESLRKIRDGEVENPVEFAQESISESRSISR